MPDKDVKVSQLILHLKNLAHASLKKGQLNRAFGAVSFASETLYMYNQFYVDDELEQIIQELGSHIKKENDFGNYSINETLNTILVYDGFGLDTRGVISMYLNALGKNGYTIYYVTNIKSKGKLHSVEKICNKYKIDTIFINMDNYKEWSISLAKIFEQIKPRVAFFYTTPFDVSGSATFAIYKSLCTRYLIDLTDHAFWIGKSSNDFFLGSREMSAYIQHYQRGIPRSKCIKLGVNLLVDDYNDHSNLPFNPETKRFIFSGGSLYKTLGDPEKSYYIIVRHLLEHHPDILFLYAGSGDDSEIRKLISEFPNRVFLINERKDFYYLIQKSVLYLNTYPMFGGMMMKYAALAKKIPVTLRHGNDSDGLLLNQEKCQIEYNSINELLIDVDRLLDDEEYRVNREKLLEGSVVTEDRFIRNIRSLIENNHTDYHHDFILLDTTEFRSEYYNRFNYNDNMLALVKKINFSLCWYFPKAFAFGVMRKIYSKFKKGINNND